MAKRKSTHERNQSLFAKFFQRSKWKKGVPAVCKPCWEIKYCPYGPLVEDFPLKETKDSKSCRIFGHDCPVFYVAESLIETKELRRVTRAIPQAVQINVVLRDGKVCAECGENISPEEVQFDHVIPYSKGGSSDASNIRVLREHCNKKKSNRFEAEILVMHAGEQLAQHFDSSFVEIYLDAVGFAHEYKSKNGSFPDANAIASEFNTGEVTSFEESIAKSVHELSEFFNSKKPEELTRQQFDSLKKRWGFSDGDLYFLKDIAQEFDERLTTLVSLERHLFARLGWYVNELPATQRKWQKL
jgi:hypothetical protein